MSNASPTKTWKHDDQAAKRHIHLSSLPSVTCWAGPNSQPHHHKTTGLAPASRPNSVTLCDTSNPNRGPQPPVQQSLQNHLTLLTACLVCPSRATREIHPPMGIGCASVMLERVLQVIGPRGEQRNARPSEDAGVWWTVTQLMTRWNQWPCVAVRSRLGVDDALAMDQIDGELGRRIRKRSDQHADRPLHEL